MGVSLVVAAISTASSVGFSVGAVAAFGGWAAVFQSFAIRAVLGIALNALTPKPKTQGSNRGYQVNSRGSALDHQIIYGKMKVGGAIVFDGTTGTTNSFLHRVIAFAGHEIESFDEIYLNDELLTIDGSGNVTAPSQYAGKVRIKEHLGTAAQAADTNLVSEVTSWTSNHKLSGIAYLYVRLKFDANAFPNGIPEISTVIKGKKVYDPRTTTTVWSDNPALCIRDYLTNTTYGLGEDSLNIDDTLVSTAANVCEFLNYPTLTGAARYTCNGAFVTAITPYELLGDILTSMGGLLWYSQGAWRMKPAYYVAPTLTLDENDLRSSVSLSTRHSRRDNFNTVKGTFRGSESNWQVTDYPEVSNSAFVSADKDQVSVIDLDLPFTDTADMARDIARIALERNRQQLTVNASFGLNAFPCQVGDIIQLTNSRFGWTAKEFEVVSWTFGFVDDNDLQVQMTLREVSSTVYDNVDDGVIYERDNTTLLSPFDVPTVGISAVARLQVLKEKLTNIVSLDITSNQTDRIDYVDVEFKKSTDSLWKTVGSGAVGLFEAIDLEDGLYDFRARAVNTFGVKGTYTLINNFEAEGAAAPPEDVTGFISQVSGSTLHLDWTPVTDLDLSFYRIRHATETTGATWGNSTTSVDKVPRPASSVALPSRSGTFMIRAYDKSLIPSPNYSSVVVTANELQTYTTNTTQTESPTFSGTKTDCTVNVSNYLEITDPSTAPSEATYDFSTYIDTTTARLVKARVDATVLRVNEAGNTFDSLPGVLSSLTGLWDDLSGDQSFADTNVEFYISTTEDDPAGTPIWSSYQKFRVGDFYGRAFRFRVVLKSTSDDVTPNITALSATVQYD